MTAYGGLAREGEHFIKTLSKKIASKKNVERSEVTCYLRTQLSFALLRSSLSCLRGTRNLKEMNVDLNDIEIHTSYKMNI